MAVSEKISQLVQNQFPDFYKEDGENFLAFIEAYYEYLEQTGKLTDGIKNLQDYRDIDTTLDEYIEYFRRDLLPSVPENVLANKRSLVKQVRSFNTTRGTLSSYKLLFRLIYGEDVEVNYPADQILKVSDGDFRIDRYLVSDFDQNTYNFIGKTIKGADSQAEALVEDVVTRVVRGRRIMQILVSNIKGTFNHMEPVRLKTDTSATGHAPIAECGIADLTIVSPGGEYSVGDKLNLISSQVGQFAKVVVTNVTDLGGTLTFSLVDGGSGYTASTDPGGSEIALIGGDGSSPASFQIGRNDLADTFAITLNTNLIGGNNVYGTGGGIATNDDGADRAMSLFANTLLSATDFGFPENGETVGNKAYRDHANAVIVIANTSDPGVTSGDSLFGVTSGANATVTAVRRAHNSTDVVVAVDAYKNFTTSEKINKSTSDGTTIGTVSSFSGNTIGYHVLQIGWIANTSISPLTEGTELVGRTSNSFGVVKKIVSLQANGYTRSAGGADDRDLYTVQVTANTTANLTSQFDTGPMKPFLENEGLRVVGANTTVGNAVSTTVNTSIENIYTKLEDALDFEASTVGTISQLSLVVGGSGYSRAPIVNVTDYDIAALGIGEAYVTIESDDVNWGTGNSQFTKLDTNDKIGQSNTGATGHVKAGSRPNVQPAVITLANGTYQTTVRVWQDTLQRTAGNITFANNQYVDLYSYNSSYTQGLTADSRTPTNTGVGRITKVVDEGVLGKNAVITAGVGANGTISGLRTIDSGFGYRQDELVTVESSGRALATSGTARVYLSGVANAEGYYATTRSHVSSARGYIQDSHYYQEFSYEIIAAISLNRYRDIAKKLVHPAGQALFGKYRVQSNAYVNIVASSDNKHQLQSNGTISINNGSFNITGSGTTLTSEFANGDSIIIEYDYQQFYKIPLNKVISATSANVTIAWANTNLSGANAYYENGGI